MLPALSSLWEGSLRRAACLTACGLYVLAAAAQGQTPQLARWAILATPQVQESGLADLLTAELGKEPGLTLVERDQFAAALTELTLDQALGAEATTSIRSRPALTPAIRPPTSA